VTRCLGDRIDVTMPEGCRRGLRGHLWEQVSLPQSVNGALLWSPANTGPLSVRNHVVTIHDISPIDHPEWFSRGFATWYRYLLPRLARRARRVITVSEFTRRRIVERFGVPESRVVAIAHGVTDQFCPQARAAVEAARRAYGLPSPYLLVVGSLQPRKNLERLLRVWRRQQCALQPLLLAIVGSPGPGFRPSRLTPAAPRVRLLGVVPDRDLPALYAGAVGFIQPSLYEGFGLPVLEAMACAVPVAASDTTALREVGGDAALYMNPLDEASMADAIRRLVEDDSWRERSRRLGCARAQQFTWERTAVRTWEVLRDAAEGGTS
jgi:glycosyltransferase involved in cell wall biosynthesis